MSARNGRRERIGILTIGGVFAFLGLSLWLYGADVAERFLIRLDWVLALILMYYFMREKNGMKPA